MEGKGIYRAGICFYCLRRYHDRLEPVMKKGRLLNSGFWLCLFIVIFICCSVTSFSQVEPRKDDSLIKNTEKKIIPSPENIQEATGIYIFLVWIWISIFVVIYLLRLKVREADRLYRLGFDPPDTSHSSDS